jgi:hypothetical protein
MINNAKLCMVPLRALAQLLFKKVIPINTFNTDERLVQWVNKNLDRFDKQLDIEDEISISVRYWGNWYDDEDCGLCLDTESINKMEVILDDVRQMIKLDDNTPNIEIDWQTSEKNWLIIDFKIIN